MCGDKIHFLKRVTNIYFFFNVSNDAWLTIVGLG